VAIEPGGGALITSMGVHQSAIWIHDASGQRPLSSEGEVASWRVFSPDASVLYYLLRRGEGPGAELWCTMVDSGKSETVFPGIAMTAFDISPDGRKVLYATAASDGQASLWVAPVDRNSPPTKLSIFDVQSPHFGDHGRILFQRKEKSKNYLERIDADGSHSSKVSEYPIAEFLGVSPGRHTGPLSMLPAHRKVIVPRSWQFRWTAAFRDGFARAIALRRGRRTAGFFLFRWRSPHLPAPDAAWRFLSGQGKPCRFSQRTGLCRRPN
jgi:hypothetical protein